MTGPIMIVGCGRSGTTLLYRMLCCHADLAWFSNLGDRWPSVPALAALSNVFPVAASHGLAARVIPVPSEAYGFWNAVNRIGGLPADEPLTEHDVAPDMRAFAAARIRSVMRSQRKPRFVNKATRNVRRMRFVDALLDDVVFVHVLRDPRATVASLLRVAFWPDLTVWCEGNVSPPAWERLGKDPTELAARLWACDVDRALRDRDAIGDGRVIEVRYEDLVGDPLGTVASIGRAAGLTLSAGFRRRCESFHVDDRNRAIGSALTASQLATITEVAGPVAERVGYVW